jgi:glycosyltransferase involved in cell wall biosynthesis/SAM-dependent methyltransferase
MTIRLFHRFEDVDVAAAQPAARDFYSVLDQLREAARSATPAWATYPAFVEYSHICFWAIRKLEYSFAAECLADLERESTGPLDVLDVGCGVVPFCNWVARRGHRVTAIDPLESDVEFLTGNDVNAFYGSDVDYRVGLGEQLEFPDNSFDVVTCISVLEHVPPGNDRVALWEMARVLKPGGRLIITFDVAPPSEPQAGQRPWPSHLRRYAQPLSPAVAERLLDSISNGFETSAADVPSALHRLTWDDVHAFWQAASSHDERSDPPRDYLAVGAVLTRRPDPLIVRSRDVSDAYLEGQRALEERVEYFSRHAEQRMDLVKRLDEVGQTLRVEVAQKEQAIEDLSSAAQEKEQMIAELNTAAQELSTAAQEKERVIAELSAVAQERQDLIVALHSVAAERLALVEEMQHQSPLQERVAAIEGVLQRQADALERLATAVSEHGVAPQLPSSTELRLLRRDKESAEAVAAARLMVIEEQQRALEAYRKAHARFRFRERLQPYVTPRLGMLYQYPPRPLVIPPAYAKPKKLATSPTISIVTPTLNQGQFIERTLRSVLDQGYPKLEYIVQDGGSNDETIDVLRTYAPALAHAVSEKDNGFAEGLNRGFRLATGEIMSYLNSDDLLLPGALNYIAWYFSRHPDVDVVYGHRVVIDEYDCEIGRWVLPPHDDRVLSWADFVPQETLFWRRALWERVGATIDESFRFAVDWDLLLRFRAAGARAHRLPRFLGAFRVHPHQKTSQELLELGADEMGRLRERALGKVMSQAEVDHGVRWYLRRHLCYDKLYRLGILRY